MHPRFIRSAIVASLSMAFPLIAHANTMNANPDLQTWLNSSGPPVEVTGSIVGITNDGKGMQFQTSELTGTPVVLSVDMSKKNASNISNGEGVTLVLAPKFNENPKVYEVIMQGARTEQAQFGARGEFSTTDESAEVLNRADDDEARAKDKDHRGKED
jgi:hypothetical protein